MYTHTFHRSALKYDAHAPISLSQLWRLFGQLDWHSWKMVNESLFGAMIYRELNGSEHESWKGVDGKELCGSIEAGQTRGTNVVRVMEHGSCRVLAQSYYDGSKESEKNVVREFLSASPEGEKFTMDALHTDPPTLELIHENEGKYITQVKDNQSGMKDELEAVPNYLPPVDKVQTHDKGHGRVESRCYWFYDLNHPLFKECLDERWQACGIKTLIRVYRKFTHIKTGKVEEQTSYYISNNAFIIS